MKNVEEIRSEKEFENMENGNRRKGEEKRM